VFAGGSYVVVQRYLHDLAAWQGLSTEQQELIIGRTKIDNVELPDDAAPRKSHKTLSTIETPDGGELDILRDNMPFGRPGHGEFGTFFIGYSRRLWVIERMLERMFIGEPRGFHDRILDVSTAITGTTFFVPSRSVLVGLGQAEDDEETDASQASVAPRDVVDDASLGIGSLRRTASDPASASEGKTS
jgi:porphyrinogen peroxidase